MEYPLDCATWNVVARGIVEERLAPLALEAVHARNLPVTDEQLHALEWMAATAGEKQAQADHGLVQAVEALEGSNIDARVLQGAANAALDYVAAPLRPYESISLLVGPAEFPKAIRALERGGFRSHPSARNGRRRFHTAHFVASNGIALDLYRPHVGGSFGGSMDPASALFAQREEFEVRRCRLTALTPEERMITTCVRVSQEGTATRLLTLRDLVQIALCDRVSLRTTDHLAATWRVEPVVAEAVCRAWLVLDVPDVVPISSWSSSYRPSRWERGPLTGPSLRRRSIFGQPKGAKRDRPISIGARLRLAGPG